MTNQINYFIQVKPDELVHLFAGICMAYRHLPHQKSHPGVAENSREAETQAPFPTYQTARLSVPHLLCARLNSVSCLSHNAPSALRLFHSFCCCCFLVVKTGYVALSLVVQVGYLGVSLTWNLVPVPSLATCMAPGRVI